MASTADTDVSVGIEEKWNSDLLLPTLVPGGLARGRLTATASDQTAYARLEVRPERQEYSTGGTYLDWRVVTITVWGLEAGVRAALDRIQTVFDPKPDGSNQFTIPGFRSCLPSSRRIEEDPSTKKGEDRWMAVAEYRVMTQRAWPGN